MFGNGKLKVEIVQLEDDVNKQNSKNNGLKKHLSILMEAELVRKEII